MNIKKFFQRKKKPTNKCVYRRDVLEYALTHAHETGLCRAIRNALVTYNLDPYGRSLDKYIPAFTHDNALYFGARKSGCCYWWPIGEWDTGRKAFLEWLIDLYKDDTTNLLEIENDQN